MLQQQLTLDPQVASREEERAICCHRSKDGWQHKPHILKTIHKIQKKIYNIQKLELEVLTHSNIIQRKTSSQARIQMF